MDELKQTWETANSLWADHKKCMKNDPKWAEKEITAKITHFQQAGYNDFINKYVIPTRYMLLHNEYNKDVFWKYLMRLKTVGYKSKDEWADRQADYVKMLWRAYNPHGSTAEANAQWQYARDNIKDETAAFEKDYETAKVKSEERHREVLSSHRDTLKQLLMDAKTRGRLEEMFEIYNQAQAIAKSAEASTQKVEPESKSDFTILDKHDSPRESPEDRESRREARRKERREQREREKVLAKERERARREMVAAKARHAREIARARREKYQMDAVEQRLAGQTVDDWVEPVENDSIPGLPDEPDVTTVEESTLEVPEIQSTA